MFNMEEVNTGGLKKFVWKKEDLKIEPEREMAINEGYKKYELRKKKERRNIILLVIIIALVVLGVLGYLLLG